MSDFVKKIKLKVGDLIGLIDEHADDCSDGFSQIEMVVKVLNDNHGKDVLFKNITYPEQEDSYGYTVIDVRPDGFIETYSDAGHYYLIARGTNAAKKSKSQAG